MTESSTSPSRVLVAGFILLAVVCLYQAFRLSQFSSKVSEDDISLALLQECVLNVQATVSTNEITEDALTPRLLLDTDDIADYVEAFPVDDYDIYPMPGGLITGNLYLDDVKDVIKDELKEGNLWETHVIDMIVKYAQRGTTILDVGAHIGVHSLIMSKLAGPTGRVYAYEPQKKLYRELVHNMRLNDAINVVPMRYAAGDTLAVIEMNPPTQGNEGGTSVGEGGDQAELRTIDSFGFKNVSLIKLDVEHLEDQVLEGARQTILESNPVILVEIQGGYLPDSAPPGILKKKAATIKRIEDMGYSVLRFGYYDYVGIPN
ncbi:MAG: FkbM family methyltransferase [Pseudomonadales bacterium]|nr:FkbM family methyltransferase [Pseudomonadales bacterium]